MTPIIKITRINNREYSFRESDKAGIKLVAAGLTIDNPQPYAYSDKITKFDKKTFTFKIGMLSTLEKFLRSESLAYEVEDYDYSLPEGVTIDDRMSGKWRHQRKAVEAFYGRRFGIIGVPTRGGKTFIASEIVRIFLDNFEGNFLFCTDTTTLFNQAVKDFKNFFERYGGIEVGEIKAGKVETNKRVTVAMVQTLQSITSARCKDRKKKRELGKYLNNLTFLAVDEVHDNCSDSKLKIYKKPKNLEFLLCLSATPYRANSLVQNLKLQEWSGDVIYNISESTLRKRGVLSDYKVFLLNIDHSKREQDLDKEDYNGHRKKLIFDNVFRNNVLLEVFAVLERLELKTLMLFQSLEHGKYISKVTGVPFISGVDKDDVREREIQSFLKKKGGFLLSSDILKKGVTLPEAQVLVNVDGGLEDANTIQKKGRVLGATKDKTKSVIIDFIDLFELYFSEHSEARLNTYIESVGEKKISILDTEKDWSKDLENRIIKWLK